MGYSEFCLLYRVGLLFVFWFRILNFITFLGLGKGGYFLGVLTICRYFLGSH